MKRYKVTVDVTSRYTIEVDAIDETEAMQKAEQLDIDCDGSFECTSQMAAIDAEQIFPEEEE